MTETQATISIIILISLILLSGFFSAAETGLMAINRYRLKHRARKKKSSAALIFRLLQRPDRLLATILIGNNCANICASALATLITLQLFGEKAVIISTILLTLAVLIFSEVAPKTLAALYPDRISKWVAYPIQILFYIFYPIVWLLNAISNGLLRLFGVRLTDQVLEPLSREELRTVVYETSGRISTQYHNMLLGILDLNQETVEDVMIPSHEIAGVDLEQDWQVIKNQLIKSKHDWVPVYKENINQIVGILQIRSVVEAALNTEMTKEKFQSYIQEPYFIPEGTPLNVQLLNFQNERKHLAMVVDEYGEILGLVTLVDILEEIVGEFATVGSTKIVEKQKDGSYVVDGAIELKDLNRLTKSKFPTKGPRTLNGLIIEYLETIPKSGLCVLIAKYPIEIIEVKGNRVKRAKVFPKLGVKYQH